MKLQEKSRTTCPEENLLGPPFVSPWDGRDPGADGRAAESSRRIRVRIGRPDGTVFDHVFPLPESSSAGYESFEREIKSLLWLKGGSRVATDAPAEWRERAAEEYRAGSRRFDSSVIGEKVFGEPVSFASLEESGGGPSPAASHRGAGGFYKGCRIGFDLGGSDRKCAAVKDGEVVFSEEVPWDPYFQKDPAYHWEGIVDSIERAAKHLPRIDAIGGSAAGIYVNNEPKVGSLFRGVAEADFDREIRPLFQRLSKAYNGVPVEVVNDGEATALSAAQGRGLRGVLGIAMGTSMAVGYVDGNGLLTPWLNELAFVPVEYHGNAPVDEWSGDRGCGAQYFSQQAVGRLLPWTGLVYDRGLSLPEQLLLAQEAAEAGHEGVRGMFRTIGVYLAYSILHYQRFYRFRHLLLLGRVLSGTGGELIRASSSAKLRGLAPRFAEQLRYLEPTEREKRHGQAIAAASLVPDERIARAFHP